MLRRPPHFPDASSIAAACGGAVLVIEAERTRAEVVEEAKRTLEATGVNLLGAVLNRRKYHIPGFIYQTALKWCGDDFVHGRPIGYSVMHELRKKIMLNLFRVTDLSVMVVAFGLRL